MRPEFQVYALTVFRNHIYQELRNIKWQNATKAKRKREGYVDDDDDDDDDEEEIDDDLAAMLMTKVGFRNIFLFFIVIRERFLSFDTVRRAKNPSQPERIPFSAGT
jgi:hypothetical protein